jgi:uroporphyrinogen decarboxylase
MQKRDGLYYDLHRAPLENAQSVDDIKKYSFPDPTDEARFVGIKELAEKTRAEGRIFILGGISAGMLEMGMWLRGFENFLCDLYSNRPLAEALIDKILELKMRYWEKALSILKGQVEIIQEGDDYGGQSGIPASGENS